MTKPFINLNGDKVETISEDILQIFKAFNPLIEAIAKSEYDNGRNATDREHHQRMRSEKISILNELRTKQEEFLTLYKSIQ